MVLCGIAIYCRVSCGIGWYCHKLHGTVQYRVMTVSNRLLLKTACNDFPYNCAAMERQVVRTVKDSQVYRERSRGIKAHYEFRISGYMENRRHLFLKQVSTATPASLRPLSLTRMLTGKDGIA